MVSDKGTPKQKLYAEQYNAIYCPERFAIVEASTKSGKTLGCLSWIVDEAWQKNPILQDENGNDIINEGQIFWWVAPVFSQAMIAFRRAKLAIKPTQIRKANDSALAIELTNGSQIQFKSGEQPDNLFGEDVWGCVIDEASRLREESWIAVRSTLAATEGRCRIIGNVKGRNNWSYKLARRAESGEDPNWKFSRLTAYDAIVGGVLSEEEVLDAKKTLPEQVFKELFLAVPSDDEGNPFGHKYIEQCIQETLSPLPPVVFGIDLAKSHDYTVIIGLDEDNNVCRFRRFQHDWDTTERWISGEIENTPALIDSTGVGDPIVERLQKKHAVTGFRFSATSKQQIMENLAIQIQNAEIGYPDGDITRELRDFGYELTRTGTHYEAISGHDDCVCALALAAWQSKDRPGWGIW